MVTEIVPPTEISPEETGTREGEAFRSYISPFISPAPSGEEATRRSMTQALLPWREMYEYSRALERIARAWENLMTGYARLLNVRRGGPERISITVHYSPEIHKALETFAPHLEQEIHKAFEEVHGPLLLPVNYQFVPGTVPRTYVTKRAFRAVLRASKVMAYVGERVALSVMVTEIGFYKDVPITVTPVKGARVEWHMVYRDREGKVNDVVFDTGVTGDDGVATTSLSSATEGDFVVYAVCVVEGKKVQSNSIRIVFATGVETLREAYARQLAWRFYQEVMAWSTFGATLLAVIFTLYSIAKRGGRR